MVGKKSLLTIGMVIFLISLITGSVFNGLAFWTDLEGMSFWGYPEVISYDSDLDSAIKITDLNCPILISSIETLQVKGTFKNTKDRDSLPFITANISKPDGVEDLIRNGQTVMFTPNQTKILNWTISNENKLENNKIMIRVFVQETLNSPPARTRHCGIMVWDIGNVKGSQLTTIFFSFSLIGMVLGLSLWYIGSSKVMRRTNKIFKLMVWIGIILILGLLSNLIGLWLLSGAMTILSIILFISIIESYFLDKVT